MRPSSAARHPSAPPRETPASVRPQPTRRTVEPPEVPSRPPAGSPRPVFCESSSWTLFSLATESPFTVRRLHWYFQRSAPNGKRESHESRLTARTAAPLDGAMFHSAQAEAFRELGVKFHALRSFGSTVPRCAS